MKGLGTELRNLSDEYILHFQAVMERMLQNANIAFKRQSGPNRFMYLGKSCVLKRSKNNYLSAFEKYLGLTGTKESRCNHKIV